MTEKLHPQAILFDMDGVLIDSLDSWWQALNNAMKMNNHPGISRKEFIERFWGHDLRENLETSGLNPEILYFCNAIYQNYVDVVKIYEDTYPTLNQLRHYKKAIITNTPKDCTSHIMKQFDLKKYFHTIVTSDDVPRGKPSPDIVFKACEHLNVQPNNVVLVGDTNSDVLAGRHAGCTVIGINIPADYTIQRLSELPALLA
ncbi:MAG: HAD family hydrolase [Candidatus Thermoplasmatota archaeon]